MMDDNGLTMDQEMVREEAIREKRDDLLKEDAFIQEWLTENATAWIILKKHTLTDEDIQRDGKLFRVLISELQYAAETEAEEFIDNHPEIWWNK